MPVDPGDPHQPAGSAPPKRTAHGTPEARLLPAAGARRRLRLQHIHDLVVSADVRLRF
jgi:hypothetical protein